MAAVALPASTVAPAMAATNSTNFDVNKLAERFIKRITEEQHLCGFSDEEVYAVIKKAEQLLAPEPALLQLTAPIIVFGDIHGQLSDLLKWFTIAGPPPKNKMLFLGDYVDRCKKSFEVMMLLISYKVLYPQQIFLLRGNHECSKMNRIYGFYEELRRKRTVRMWRIFNIMFNELPLTAVISKRILCMHGGISPKATSWDKLYELKKPKSPKECDDGIAVDLMWSDPTCDPCGGFQFNTNRATSVMFDESSITDLCQKLDIDFVCRAHEVVQKGHHWQFNQRIVTLFSAPNYCGAEGNCGSIMKVTGDLEVTFATLRPLIDKTNLTASQLKTLQRQAIAMAARSPDPTAKKVVLAEVEVEKRNEAMLKSPSPKKAMKAAMDKVMKEEMKKVMEASDSGKKKSSPGSS